MNNYWMMQGMLRIKGVATEDKTNPLEIFA